MTGGGVNLARLGYLIDTAGLDRGRAAQDALTASGVRLGNTADLASTKLSSMAVGAGRAGQQMGVASQRTAEFNAQLLAQGRALAGATASLEQMARALATSTNAQGQAIVKTSTYFAALKDLTVAQQQQAAAAGLAAGQMTMLGTAAGTLAGLFAFQLLSSVSGVVSAIAGIPLESARAADALTRLEAQLKFAFRGSATAARQAREDIIAISQSAGIPYSQMAQNYAELAISGRSAGLTRRQVTGLSGAFADIGLLTGADQGRIGRATWQLQQALAIGRLNGQDYRLMAQNLPAIDDALAAGLGVNPNSIFGMVSRGEIDGEKLVEGIIKGVDILKKNADGLPETMERASGRLTTEWELMLTQMGEQLRSSEFFQSMTRGATGFARDVRRNTGSVEDQIAFLESIQHEPERFARAGGPQRLEDLRARVGYIRRDEGRNRQRQQWREWREQVGIRRANALSEAQLIDPYAQQRTDLLQSVERMRRGLAEDGWNPRDRVAVERAVSLLEAQIARIGTAFDALRRSATEAAADLAAFGPGGGFEIAQRARAIQEQALGQGQLLGDDTARRAALGERVFGERRRNMAEAQDLALRRRFLVAAAGGTAAERRAAQMEYDVARYAGEQFGQHANDNTEARAAVADFRANREESQRQADEEALRRRAATDAERLRTMREQLGIRHALGQQGRIEAAQLQRAQELRREGLNLSREQLAIEMAQVAAGVRINEQLELQGRIFGDLTEAADTAGTAITRGLRAAIIDGARTGVLKAEGFFDVLADSALRVADRIMAALTRPFEDAAVGFVQGFINNLAGGAGALFGGSRAGIGARNTGMMYGPTMNAYGNVIPFGAGGVRSSPHLFPMAAGAGIMAEAGAEAIIPLKRGPDGKLGVAAGDGGGGMVVQIFDQRTAAGSEAVETRESRGPDGRRMLQVLVRDTVKKEVGAGAIDPEMRSRYGAAPMVRRE